MISVRSVDRHPRRAHFGGVQSNRPSSEDLQALLALARSHRNLEQAVRWGLARGAEIDVLAQDEFTHDVIVALPTGQVLVYDST